MRRIAASLMFLGLLGLANLYLPHYEWVPYWFNHFMHFMGGFSAGAFCGVGMAYLLDLRRAEDKFLRFVLIGLAIFFGAIALGALWEEYEYYFISRKTLSEWTWLHLYDDTLIDMKMDREGGSAALAFFALRSIFKYCIRFFRKK